MSGTERAYGATRLLHYQERTRGIRRWYAPMRCYAMSGTDIAHGDICLRMPCYAISGTDIAYGNTRTCYTMSGTHLAYGATRVLRDVQY
eukprot:2594303-Rhodomonas_salina.2